MSIKNKYGCLAEERKRNIKKLLKKKQYKIEKNG